MRVDRPKRIGWRGLFVWGLLLGAVAFFQWPMLKGTYYKRVKSEAPQAAVEWRSDYQAAADEAKRNGKPVLLTFSAAWCPPCVVMKHDVWPDPEVGRAVNSGFVPVLVDVDDPKSPPVAGRYEVEGIPAVLVVGPDGRVLRRAAYMSKPAVLAFLSGV